MTAIAYAQPSLFTPAALAPSWPFADPARGAILEPMAYDLIMADPPWRFETYSEKGDGKSASQHYETMTIDAIKRLPVGDLARRDCVLWLWATGSMIPQQIEVLAAWGFAFSTMGCWVKETTTGKLAFGTGYRLRDCCEYFLIGIAGDPKTARTVRSVVKAARGRHSEKPSAAYRSAEAMMPGARRADLFSRRNRPGWESWGLETGIHDEL